MKKILVLVLALMLAFSASAQQVPFAGEGADKALMDVQKGVAYAADGSFSAKTYEAEALVNLFYEKLVNYAGGGMLYMYVSLDGNVNTGVCYPCLNVLYAGAEALEAEYVMIALEGVRYEFPVSSEVKANGRYKVETLRAFLTAEGLEMVETLKKAEKANITLLGKDQYTQLLDAKANFANQKNGLGAKSLSALELPMGAPDFSAYSLLDLAYDAFESKTGVACAYSVKKIDEECSIRTETVFGLIADGANAASIRQAQELLIQKGFLAGVSGTVVNAPMISAVKSAQAYFGMNETGYADAELINRLSAEEMTCAVKTEKNEKIVYDYETEDLAIAIDRWWIAKKAETTVPGASVGVSDKSNVLIVLDGSVKSNAVKNLSLAWEISGEMVLNNKWSFPVNLYNEVQNGEALSATLGMLCENRLLVTCEVPEAALEREGGWVLKIRSGADTFEFELNK